MLLDGTLDRLLLSCLHSYTPKSALSIATIGSNVIGWNIGSSLVVLFAFLHPEECTKHRG
jgi:hypothetical protein